MYPLALLGGTPGSDPGDLRKTNLRVIVSAPRG